MAGHQQTVAVGDKSEVQFPALAQSIPAIVLVHQQGQCRYLNAAAETMIGYAREEMLGQNFWELVHPDYRDLVRQRGLLREAGDAQPSRYEIPILIKSGELRWLDCTACRTEFEGMPAVLAVAFDVTRSRQAEEKLSASEERFRQVVEHIREVFWMTNLEKTQMLYVSPGYEEIWGRSCTSLYASPRDWLEAIHPEDCARVQAAALSKQAQGEYHEIYRIIRSDGSIRWIEDRAFPIRNEHGKVYRITGIADDITVRKRAAEQSAAFSTLGYQLSGASTAQDAAAIIVGIAWELFHWDACYLHLYSPVQHLLLPILTMDTLEGKRIEIPEATFTLDPSPLMLEVMEKGARCINRPGPPAFTPAGSAPVIPFGDKCRPSASMMYVPIRRGSTSIGILSIQSYTPGAYSPPDLEVLQALADHGAAALDRIRVEASFLQAQKEILEISARERRAIGHDLHDGLGQFLAGLALRAKFLEEHIEKEGSLHVEVAREIVTLANSALEQARGLARGMDPIEVELNGLASALEKLAADAQILFGVLCQFQADTVNFAFTPLVSGQIYRIAQQAITNAARHGQARCIRITLTEHDGQVGLLIHDDGRGFAASDDYPGMGLRIMRHRACCIGANLTIDSEPGRGTKVRCELPRACGPA